MRNVLFLTGLLLISFLVHSQDSIVKRALYTTGKNLCLEGFYCYSKGKTNTNESISGFGLDAILGYQTGPGNFGLGTGIHAVDALYIPFFGTIRLDLNRGKRRVFLYGDYGFLWGKGFGNTYDDGSFFNLGGGFRYYYKNYESVIFSVATSDRQLNKNNGIRNDKRGIFVVFKVGFVVF
ncbi:MAG: hypothetical protein NTU44_02980 [Bacteroidetes bacterium]|nr:hypothetical protein [Bacteroidota bacterium]